MNNTIGQRIARNAPNVEKPGKTNTNIQRIVKSVPNVVKLYK